MTKFSKIYFIFVSVIIVAVAILAFKGNLNIQVSINDFVKADAVESVLTQKLSALNNYNNTNVEISKFGNDSLNYRYFTELEPLFKTQQIGFFHYYDKSLVHWSTSDIPMPTSYSESLNHRLLKLENGWYLATSQVVDKHIFVALYQIKRQYSYENDLLTTEFSRDFNLPSNIAISDSLMPESVKITLPNAPQNLYLFSTENASNLEKLTRPQTAKIILIFLLLLLIVPLFVSYSRKCNKHWQPATILLAVLLCIRILLLATGYFDGFENVSSFGPNLYSQSWLQPSFAYLVFDSLLLFVFAIFFAKTFNINSDKIKDTKASRIITNILFAIFIVVINLFLISQLFDIVWNSSVPYDFADMTSLTIYSYIGIFVAILFSVSVLLIIAKSVRIFKEYLRIHFVFVAGFVCFAIVTPFVYVNVLSTIIPEILFFGVSLYIIYCVQNDKNKHLHIFISLVVVSLSVSYSLSSSYTAKEVDSYKTLAYNFYSARDFNVEMIFQTLNDEIKNDSLIIASVNSHDFVATDSLIMQLLGSKRYLHKYDIQTTICADADSLFIADENISTGCFEYFRDQIYSFGVIIPGSNFYFMNNHTGRISYLGVISFMSEQSVIKIYIEANSKIFSEGLGYPDLLLDKSLVFKRASRVENYAKYNNNKLVASKGTYKYLFSLPPETIDKEEFAVVRNGGYVHFVYCPDNENKIILSKRNTLYSTMFLSFWVVFIMLMCVYFPYFVIRLIKNQAYNKFNTLNRKVRFSFIGILLLSLLVSITISLYFLYGNYLHNDTNTVSDKVQSVLAEINANVTIDEINNEEAYVDDFLIFLSDVLCADINIFDKNGLLKVSSRQQFFNKGLKGKYMDPCSYRSLVSGNGEFVMQYETVDAVEYLSVYVPMRNSQGDVMAYLNLPYFAEERERADELLNYIIAYANVIAILLFVTLIFAIIISRQITSPLTLVQESIGGMGIGKTEKINYSKNDEIGMLVKEYNRKVDELNEAAQKLAASERESAWREMARQIAHEIKNPLTPMKLNIQYIEQTYNPNSESWGQKFKMVTKTLIEQIDVLSAIATEFSNFAKMPIPQKSNINLLDIIKTSVQLYQNTENVDIVVNNDVQDAIIFADKEQMLRVFTNLIKNSIQAIPADRRGLINISLTKQNDSVEVLVADNGCGISEEMRSKIFQPNFTTKSAGMGLGLSMVKNMLIGNNAEISFDTEVGVGTTFKIVFNKE